MNDLARRVVSGEIFGVTDYETAQRKAIARLNNNPQDLIREIEADIKQQVGHMHIAVRGGNYTPEVVRTVTELYQSKGWHINYHGGYWLTLE